LEQGLGSIYRKFGRMEMWLYVSLKSVNSNELQIEYLKRSIYLNLPQ